ncbi:MAG TPA: FG-GAP repeat protein, partial [Polyangiaceae bacterium]
GSFGTAAGGELFGRALAAGDFDDDGCDDVAIGAPGALVGGAVIIAYGGSGGIDPSVSEAWDQDSPAVNDVAEAADFFGGTLTAADFDGDGYDDIAIGVPSEDVGTIESAGLVNVLYGSASGITSDADQVFHLNSTLIDGTADEFENFAYSLESGDFDGDGFAELAVGTLGDAVDGVHNSGSVLILRGSVAGLSSNGEQLLTQKALGFPVGTNGLFSRSLAAGDFDGNDLDDLAIGSYLGNEGAFHVLYGTASGLSLTGAQVFTQSTPGVPGVSSSTDRFGMTLVAGNFDGGTQDDLAISATGEVINGFDRAGTVTILYGHSSGLATQPVLPDLIHQNMTSDAEAEATDLFGTNLASGDFNSDGFHELLVAGQHENLDGLNDAGAVHVFFGSGAGPQVNSQSQFLRQ